MGRTSNAEPLKCALAGSITQLVHLRSNSGILAMWKAVLTVIGAVYGGVDHPHLGERPHGSIFYPARSDSRGWDCCFSIRD